jgi:hypothetical protein
MLKVNGRQTPSGGKSSHCLWQGQLKKRIWQAFNRKPISQLNRNLSKKSPLIKIAYFIPIIKQTSPP